METQSPFELTAAIGRWRETVAAVPALRGRDVDELEGHLRDAVVDLRRGGLSDEEAFLIGTRRLGSPVLLATEFGKVHGDRVWAERALWVVLGTLGLGIIGSLSNLVADLAWLASLQLTSAGWLAGTVFAATSLVAYAGLCVLVARELRQEGRCVQWFRATLHGRPLRTAFLVIALSAGASLLTGWGFRLGIGVLPPEQLHQGMQWRSYGALVVFYLSLPSILVWLLVRYQRTFRESDGGQVASEAKPY